MKKLFLTLCLTTATINAMENDGAPHALILVETARKWITDLEQANNQLAGLAINRGIFDEQSSSADKQQIEAIGTLAKQIAQSMTEFNESSLLRSVTHADAQEIMRCATQTQSRMLTFHIQMFKTMQQIDKQHTLLQEQRESEERRLVTRALLGSAAITLTYYISLYLTK